MKPTRMNHLNWSRSAGVALTATLVIVCCPAARAVDWLNSGTTNNWNDSANWAGGSVPNDTGAGIFSATGNIATISSDVTATPTEIVMGGWGNAARVDHVAGTLSTHHIENTWPPGWMLVGFGNTGTAIYNLADTATTGGALTTYGTGSGTLNVADSLFMGEPGNAGNGSGGSTINVNTTGALNVQWDMVIGTSGWTANANVDAGTVHANNFSLAKYSGSATAGTGNLNISGGSVIANYRMTMAEGGANNLATVNQIGGAVSIGSAADWAGLSMASASGDGNGGTATYNLNGGTLSTRYVRSENSGANTKGTSIFNFNGGTLKALDNRIDGWNQFIGGDQAITHAYVKAGGAVIDTNGFNVLVGQRLEGDIVSTGGGLTKNGLGQLEIANQNTFTGAVVINAGTLYANSGSGPNNKAFSSSSGITVNSGATLRAGSNSLFGWDGSQAKPITINGGTAVAENGDLNVGLVTLNGGTLSSVNEDGFWGSWHFGRATDKKLLVTDNSTVSAQHVSFTSGATIEVAAGKNLNFTGTIGDAGGDGSSSVIKQGSGTLTLAGTNTYTGKTTVTGGSLALAPGGSIANSSEIALNGGNFNVSAVAAYSTGASQALTGSGSITGDITVTGTLAIGNSPGTMTFSNNLTIGGSAGSNFEFTDIAMGSGTYDLAQGGDGSQAVTFGGTLNLFFSGGTYADNSTVQIFNFGTYDGNFAMVNSTGLGVNQTAEFNASTGFVTVIPEPGAALLGGISLLALLRRRRN